jgi:ubiquitin carboxyl-terminal hydrolase 34
MIFDKLETAIKPTPFKYLLDGVYGGKTCTQLVCS